MALGNMWQQEGESQPSDLDTSKQAGVSCEVGVSAPIIASGDLFKTVSEALSSCKTG